MALLASRMESCGKRGTKVSSSAEALLEYFTEVTMSAFSYGLYKHKGHSDRSAHIAAEM